MGTGEEGEFGGKRAELERGAEVGADWGGGEEGGTEIGVFGG